ncbi:uncharacterized protein ASCRUDRAFT_153466 [Ascoidea rubescens DSM 1968]|uniref:Uncharacterized protein n=1 Tax=Ascoidea rubescens DSM 1968 TaxID=1344418 RepID=A0A1D2VFG1_9ASCO|nr:hypothetical protein ASCRUDRAFT_153466 [Ascoidea rubescens DSM 1968]ODV60339.1 hypothetical protein ASCRUDRAFT_153466 [Ascoidea rubescens DSM 1968]
MNPNRIRLNGIVWVELFQQNCLNEIQKELIKSNLNMVDRRNAYEKLGVFASGRLCYCCKLSGVNVSSTRLRRKK